MYFLKRVLSWASGINWRPFFQFNILWRASDSRNVRDCRFGQ